VLLAEVGAGSHRAFAGSDKSADHPVAVLAGLCSRIGPVGDVSVGLVDHAVEPLKKRVVADGERESDYDAMGRFGEPPADVPVDGEDFQLMPRVRAWHDPEMFVLHWKAGALAHSQVEIEDFAGMRARAESRAKGRRACGGRSDDQNDAGHDPDGGRGSSAGHDEQRDRGRA